MKDWLIFITEQAVVLFNAMALIIVAFGTIEAFLRSLKAFFDSSPSARQFRTTYLRYARWLVAGLTFLLAADIVALSIAPTWQEIGVVAAISGIRTFLSFFLERELADVERSAAEPPRASYGQA